MKIMIDDRMKEYIMLGERCPRCMIGVLIYLEKKHRYICSLCGAEFKERNLKFINNNKNKGDIYEQADN